MPAWVSAWLTAFLPVACLFYRCGSFCGCGCVFLFSQGVVMDDIMIVKYNAER